MNDALLRTENLSLGRGDRLLVKGLSLSVAPGVLLHLRGPNGVGKTSLLEVLAGLRKAETGEVTRAQPALHWLGHKNALNADLSPLENLRFWCVLQNAQAGGINAALDRLGLSHLRHRPCRTLSAGQKRRAALSRLLVVRRGLWLLDEPLSALDAEGLQRFAEMLGEHLDAGGGGIVTSHQPLPVAGRHLRELELA